MIERPDAERRQRAGEVKAQAVEIPPHDRRDFVDDQCAGDPALLALVEQLLGDDAPPPVRVGCDRSEHLAQRNGRSRGLLARLVDSLRRLGRRPAEPDGAARER